MTLYHTSSSHPDLKGFVNAEIQLDIITQHNMTYFLSIVSASIDPYCCLNLKLSHYSNETKYVGMTCHMFYCSIDLTVT